MGFKQEILFLIILWINKAVFLVWINSAVTGLFSKNPIGQSQLHGQGQTASQKELPQCMGTGSVIVVCV